MCCYYLALVFLGLTRSIEGTLVFTQERGNQLYFQEGSTANLIWTYTVDNRKAELARIIWSVFNKTDSSFVALIVEGKDGTVKHNPNAPPTYGPERVSKEGQASLVIKNVTFKDSTTYKCLLDGETGVTGATSSVKLIVTGHPFVFPLVTFIKKGETANLNCNATGVPGENITWKRKTKQDELQIINDNKYQIISSGSGTSQLIVKDISINDTGYYVCDTSAIVNQPSSARAFLEVESLSNSFDTCESTNQSASKGVSSTICCPVRGFPPPEVTWNLPDGTEQTTGNTILPITPKGKDFGTYTCSAMGLNPDPVVILINLHEEGLKTSITAGDITQRKQSVKLNWKELKVKGAISYICRIWGPDINSSSVLGEKPSFEIPYNSLIFKSENNKPNPVHVMIEVLAVGENDVLGKGGPFNLTISGAIIPGPGVSFTLLIVVLISAVFL